MNKKEFFSGTLTPVLKVTHYVFFLLSEKEKQIKNAFPVHNIIIGYSHAVPYRHYSPLRVMLGCLIILVSISG